MPASGLIGTMLCMTQKDRRPGPHRKIAVVAAAVLAVAGTVCGLGELR